MTSADLRAQLVYALRDDLIGPDEADPRDAAHLTESLSTGPSHWYLAGFLAPTGQAVDEKEDPAADGGIDSAMDGPEEGEADAPVASRRPVFPSSFGVSVLVGPGERALTARVTYGTYAPGAPRTTTDAPPALTESAGDKLPWPYGPPASTRKRSTCGREGKLSGFRGLLPPLSF